MVVGAAAELYAASPTVIFDLRATDDRGSRVHALALRVQIRIEPARRRYSAADTEHLADLFGEPARWSESLRPFLWTHASTVTGPFTGTSEIALPVTLTYDFEVAAARYMHSLEDGEIPLVLLFSGTIFRTGGERLLVEPVPWNTEARFKLPVHVWREVMDRYFPGEGWLRLRRETIDALGRLKNREALPTFDQAVELLLKRTGAEQA